MLSVEEFERLFAFIPNIANDNRFSFTDLTTGVNLDGTEVPFMAVTTEPSFYPDLYIPIALNGDNVVHVVKHEWDSDLSETKIIRCLQHSSIEDYIYSEFDKCLEHAIGYMEDALNNAIKEHEAGIRQLKALRRNEDISR